MHVYFPSINSYLTPRSKPDHNRLSSFYWAKASETPALQLVPPAMAWTADHWPEAQRWKLVPPIQFHAPSFVHAPVKPPPVVPEPVVDPVEPEDGAAAAADVAGGAAAAVEATTGAAEEAALEVGTGATETPAALPPPAVTTVGEAAAALVAAGCDPPAKHSSVAVAGIEAAAAEVGASEATAEVRAGAEEACTAAEVGTAPLAALPGAEERAGTEPADTPEGLPEPPAPGATVGLAHATGPLAAFAPPGRSYSIESPGSGNARSVDSVVAHPAPT